MIALQIFAWTSYIIICIASCIIIYEFLLGKFPQLKKKLWKDPDERK